MKKTELIFDEESLLKILKKHLSNEGYNINNITGMEFESNSISTYGREHTVKIKFTEKMKDA